MTPPTPGQVWIHRGTGLKREVLQLLPGYARMSVPGPRFRGSYIDVPLDRFGAAGPEGYEKTAPAVPGKPKE